MPPAEDLPNPLQSSPHPYHHGDLRHALVRAAQDLIDEHGITALTLREVARKAGVSHNAPYNHFGDKAQLIAAVAEDGFAQFADQLIGASESTTGTSLDKVLAIGVAYVHFAFTRPAVFRLMFRPELWQPMDEYRTAPYTEFAHLGADGSFMVLYNGLAQCQSDGLVGPGDVMLLSLSAWSMVHGLAMLVLDGPAGRLAENAEEAARLAMRVTEVLRMGLQARP